MNKRELAKFCCNKIFFKKKWDEVVLHDNILDILFKHKEEIYKKFIDIRGVFLIDHFAINIVDPEKKLLFFLSHLRWNTI